VKRVLIVLLLMVAGAGVLAAVLVGLDAIHFANNGPTFLKLQASSSAPGYLHATSCEINAGATVAIVSGTLDHQPGLPSYDQSSPVAAAVFAARLALLGTAHSTATVGAWQLTVSLKQGFGPPVAYYYGGG